MSETDCKIVETLELENGMGVSSLVPPAGPSRTLITWSSRAPLTTKPEPLINRLFPPLFLTLEAWDWSD